MANVSTSLDAIRVQSAVQWGEDAARLSVVESRAGKRQPQ